MGYRDYLTNVGALADLNAKRSFLDELLVAYKAKNMSETVNIFQYLHMQSRLSNWVVTVPSLPQYGPFGGKTYTINLMNVYPTADIEGAYYALIWGVADDMSQPDHWLSQDRLNWLANEVKVWMGWP